MQFQKNPSSIFTNIYYKRSSLCFVLLHQQLLALSPVVVTSHLILSDQDLLKKYHLTLQYYLSKLTNWSADGAAVDWSVYMFLSLGADRELAPYQGTHCNSEAKNTNLSQLSRLLYFFLVPNPFVFYFTLLRLILLTVPLNYPIQCTRYCSTTQSRKKCLSFFVLNLYSSQLYISKFKIYMA